MMDRNAGMYITVVSQAPAGGLEVHIPPRPVGIAYTAVVGRLFPGLVVEMSSFALSRVLQYCTVSGR